MMPGGPQGVQHELSPDLDRAGPADDPSDFGRRLWQLTPRTPVTPVLVAANIGLFAAMVWRGVHPWSPNTDSLIAWGANYGPRTAAGEWWRLVSSAFLHVGVAHLLLNLWVLRQVGGLVERLLGNWGFLAAYLFSAVAGSLASVAWRPGGVSAGASGAIFGLFGALIAFLVHHRRVVPRAVLDRLRTSAVAFVGCNVAFGLLVPNIDQAAHLGGLAGGFLFGLVLAHPPSAAGAASRPRRLGLAVILGAAVFPTLAWALPRPVDWMGELDQLTAMEERALGAYRRATDQAQGGQISDQTLAQVIEREILPQWRTARQHLGSLSGERGVPTQSVRRLERYMAAREEAFELLAEAARTGNQSMAKSALAKHTEATRLGQASD
ncbi:rhomboid family intramembrane serine protease [Myxococcota bacterium]